jgi:hypothetical protein
MTYVRPDISGRSNLVSIKLPTRDDAIDRTEPAGRIRYKTLGTASHG